MFEQTAKVENYAPSLADFCAMTGPIKSISAAACLQSGQQGKNGCGNWNGVRSGNPTLRLRKGDRSGMKIDQTQIEPCFPQAASGCVPDLEGNKHPLKAGIKLHDIGNSLPDAGNFVVGKNRSFGHGAFLGAVVQHGHGTDKAPEAPLAMDPFQRLDVVHGHVSANRLSIGARMIQAPCDVLIRVNGGKFLQGYARFVNESGEVAPGVVIMPFGGCADGVGFNHSHNPRMVRFDCPLTHGELGSLLLSLRPVERVIHPVLGGFGLPLSGCGFVAHPEPLTVFASINSSHVTSVANHPKTQTNKG